MLKATVAVGALAGAMFATTLTNSSALANTPNCPYQVNPYVACTDKLKAKTIRSNAIVSPRAMPRSRRP